MKYIEKIIQEISDEENITIEKYCDGYCLKLSKNNKTTFFYDNIFENNSSALYKILKDKSAVYEILNKHNIPCVEHFYFFSKGKIDETLENSLLNHLKRYKKLVIKHNEGMSGHHVFYIDNSNDLISKSKTIFNKYHTLSLSPFYNFLHEYRVIVLNGTVKLVFDKIRPFVVGDGINSIQKLSNIKYGHKMKFSKNIDPNLILKQGEKITLNWKHNLNFGAVPKVVTDSNIINSLTKIALDASQILGINFASIDIIETDSHDLKVLEINGSVCMGKFASYSEANHKLAKNIYKEAILSNLN